MIELILKNIIQLSAKKIIFPYYHIVSDEECPHVKNLYPIKRVSEFEKELDILQKYFQPLNLEELTHYILTGTQPQKPSFFLSFDDGLRECYSIIAPILKKRKIPAAFFLNTDFVDNRNLFYRYKVSLIIEKIRSHNPDNFPRTFGREENELITAEKLLSFNYNDTYKIDKIAKELNLDFDEFLSSQKPYMTWDEIKELKTQGFYFGGHSKDHPLYNLISKEEQLQQTTESVNKTVEKLNLDYRIFSFPFTDDKVSKTLFNQIYNEGICDLTFATGRFRTDEFKRNIHRFGFEHNQSSPESFLLKRYLTYWANSLLGRNKMIHKG